MFKKPISSGMTAKELARVGAQSNSDLASSQTTATRLVPAASAGSGQAANKFTGVEGRPINLKLSVDSHIVAASLPRPLLIDLSLADASNPPTAKGPTRIEIASPADLGRLVRKAREASNLSQQSFADLAGVGRRFVSEIENGKPTLELGKVLKVAAAAGISLFAQERRGG